MLTITRRKPKRGFLLRARRIGIATVAIRIESSRNFAIDMFTARTYRRCGRRQERVCGLVIPQTGQSTYREVGD